MALLVLLPALAVLQYRWVGQVSNAERERMHRNVRNAAAQFRDAFEGEIARAILSLRVGPSTVLDGNFERYADRHATWFNTAAHPQMVANMFVVDAQPGELQLRRWNSDAGAFEPSGWTPALSAWRRQFEQALTDFRAGRGFERRQLFRDEESLIVAPVGNLVVPPRPGPRPQTVTPVFGFTIMELDLRYIREQMLPELATQHFVHAEGDSYRVAVIAADEPAKVLYRSDPDAPIDVQQADATVSLFGRGDPGFFFARGGGPGSNRDSSARQRDGAPDAGRDGERNARDQQRGGGRRDDFGRWRLIVQHQSGSLEAAVGTVRRRNLMISFGVLMLLTLSVASLTMTSRRAQRLARQQMEFVAGVSHELRTPVAVIRSAGENLSQGVVGNAERVKRYGQMIEGEARRLGEMVERVLQYAGIESGLGYAARAPLSATDVIEAAVQSETPLAGDVRIDRKIAPDLPPIIGDASALRSAVQNLIANAVKYGGADRWVGIRAEQGRGRRGPEVHITVSDHGAGIPAEELPHIFDPFYRGADALSRQVHGNGLGLSLVKRIVAAHGGRVSVTTRPGAGSAFTIALPAAGAEARDASIAADVRAPAPS